MKKTLKRSSETLLKIAAHQKLKEKVTYGLILEALGDRAFGIVLLFFALPSALPFSAIPGVSVIFSIPIALFACQMMLGRKTLWLPHFLADRAIPHQTVSKVIHAAVPYLVKIEYLLKPRLAFMTGRLMEILNGLIILGLAILLMFPIPFSNFIFGALLIVFSLGLIEKDGLFIIVGYIGTLFYLSFIYVFILAVIKHLL